MANAEQIVRKNGFFNFEYAKTVWLEVSAAELDDIFEQQCPPGGPDDVWTKSYNQDPSQAMKELETNQDAQIIMKCVDTQRAYDVWVEAYQNWRGDLSVYGSKGWNKDTRSIKCLNIQAANVITNRCDDLPDWRSKDAKAADDAAIAKGCSRWKNNKKC